MGKVLGIFFGILGICLVAYAIYDVIDEARHGEERIIEKCKQECNDLDLEYRKNIFGEFRCSNQCICKSNGEIKPIW